MKKAKWNWQIIWVLQLLLLLHTNDVIGWMLVQERDNIRVFVRPNPNSKIDEFRGTTTVNVGIESVLALLLEVEDQPKWMDKCIEGRVVKELGENERIFYNVTDLPWPLSDRDVVLHGKTAFDSQARIHFTFSDVKNHAKWVSKQAERVRVPLLKGSMILDSLDENHTRVTYTIKMDPGGKIPDWLANYASRSIPYRTLDNVRELAKTRKYTDKAKQLPQRHHLLMAEYMKARVKVVGREFKDDELMVLLQSDKELIETLVHAKGDRENIIRKRIKSNYSKENGRWFFQTH